MPLLCEEVHLCYGLQQGPDVSACCVRDDFAAVMHCCHAPNEVLWGAAHLNALHVACSCAVLEGCKLALLHVQHRLHHSRPIPSSVKRWHPATVQCATRCFWP